MRVDACAVLDKTDLANKRGQPRAFLLRILLNKVYTKAKLLSLVNDLAMQVAQAAENKVCGAAKVKRKVLTCAAQLQPLCCTGRTGLIAQPKPALLLFRFLTILRNTART